MKFLGKSALFETTDQAGGNMNQAVRNHHPSTSHSRLLSGLAARVALAAFGFLSGCTGSSTSLSATVSSPCYRFPVGSEVQQHLNLQSYKGTLAVNLGYQTAVDIFGNTQYCYTTATGLQSPTLRLSPGEHLLMNLTNQVPADGHPPDGAHAMHHGTLKMTADSMKLPRSMKDSPGITGCGDSQMTQVSTNVHFHGSHGAPICHQDYVVTTYINAGETFDYNFQLPTNQPPGLYWYHPHVHGLAESAALGGATGAIIVNGIENVQPAVAGLPEQVLIFRDNLVPSLALNNSTLQPQPTWDLSLNYVPITYPDYTPATLHIKPSQRQFWRVANAGADSILNLQLQYDGVPQPLEIVSLDGIPVGSAQGTQQGSLFTRTQIFLPPAGRAEFIVNGPSLKVQTATLYTLNVDTGPGGEYDPTRPLMSLIADPSAPDPEITMPRPSNPVNNPNPIEIAQLTPSLTRQIYFSEVLSDPNDPNAPTIFYITEQGHPELPFSLANGPSIVTQQGTVEDWIIENHAREIHVFHIHQLHFLALERNGVALPSDEVQFRDTLEIPAWSGNPSDPYPSIKVRMDFTGNISGYFMYHCHILEHEDAGMMALLQVLPASGGTSLLEDHSTYPQWLKFERELAWMGDWIRAMKYSGFWPTRFSGTIL